MNDPDNVAPALPIALQIVLGVAVVAVVVAWPVQAWLLLLIVFILTA